MLLRRLVLSSLLPFSVFAVAQTSQPRIAAQARAAAEVALRSPSADLPVRRVVLYKNGVGYFEHAGRVTGNQAVTIDFTSSQLDDALQSLTALDLGGGRITGVSYNSTTPLNQQLKNIPLGLGEKPSTTDLYAALRGARVEITGAGAAISGRIVHYEIRSEKNAAGGTADHRVLTLVTDTGEIHSLEIAAPTSVRVADGDLRRDLNDYLALLASTQTRQLRHLTLEAQGSGAREIRLSYISEVPVWKSTYRIVFPNEDKAGTPTSAASVGSAAILQGWAVVDNTVGSDWNNVQLSLVAGAPQSFIQPLSQPIYATRPEVPVPEAANAAPVTHEGAESKSTAQASESLMIAAPLPETAPSQRVEYFSNNVRSVDSGAGGGFAAGVLGGIANGVPLEDQSTSASSTGFDDYFEYTLSRPVTIRKNESALVPVLQTQVEAEPVTLWNPANPVPLRALWLTNPSKLTLDRGSFSVFENGEFAGEGLTDPIHAGERRLLSYAADQAVRVNSEGNLLSAHLRHLTVHDGYLTERSEEIRDRTYVVHNAAPDTRDVIIEHPVQNGWKLNSEVKPVETSASWYRFNVVTQAGETVRLHVGETHIRGTRYQITGIGDDQLQIILSGSDRPALEQALAPVLAARTSVHDLDVQIDTRQHNIDRIVEDQKRLHDNLQGLKDSPEERALARRYVGEMNTDEDQLGTLRKDQAALIEQRKAAQQTLDNAIRNLNLDEDV